MDIVVTRPQRMVFLVLLGLALALRLGWVLLVDPQPTLGGGDASFYMHLSEQLVNGNGLSYHNQPVAVVGPAYPLYLAVLRWLCGPDNVLLAARIGQALIGSLMVGAVFVIGRLWVGTGVGLAAAALLAVDLRFIVEVGSISTETLLATMLAVCLWVYLKAIEQQRYGLWLLAGISLGMATLTRAVVQFLPAVLLFHLWATGNARRVWWQGGLMLAGFAIVVCPWIIRNWVVFGVPTISQGGAAHFWMGARGDGKAIGYVHMMEDVETIRIGEGGADRYAYVGSALETIMAHPIQYMVLRLRVAGEAYLQPYGTVTVGDVFGSESIKGVLLSGERHALLKALEMPALWPKIWIYIIHYSSISLAILYMFTQINIWRQWSLLALTIIYFSAVYSFLTIIPRYLFPVMPFYLLLASAMLVDNSRRIFSLKRHFDLRLGNRNLDTKFKST